MHNVQIGGAVCVCLCALYHTGSIAKGQMNEREMTANVVVVVVVVVVDGATTIYNISHFIIVINND